jgi:IS5 family transposase
MNQPKADLFVQERRQEKLVQFTGVLRKLEQLVDWPGLAAAVNQATGREAAQPKGGRPAYPTVALLKILVLQQLHGNLSDEAMEYALLDRASWQHFVGLAQARDLPDARTLWVFKEQLAQGGGGGAMALFEVVGQQLAQAGLQARGGQLIDATLITVPKAHLDKQEKATLKAGKTPSHWSAKKTAHIDTDARWTAKREVYCFGYKAHVNTDQQHKLIRAIEVTPANVDDRVPLERLIDQSQPRKQSGKTVHADRGYHSAATRALLQAMGLIDAVARKDDAKRFDQTDLHRRNQKLARIRARVEHVFGAWEKTMGKTIRTIGGVRATAQITIQATVYNLRRWVTLNGKGACAG